MKIDIDWNLEAQTSHYLETIAQIKKGFYQENRFYLLPTMPEKFRDRVVFLPNEDIAKKIACAGNYNHQLDCVIRGISDQIYAKQKARMNNVADSVRSNLVILKNLAEIYPNSKKINITISPSLYGALGTYKLTSHSITLKPRYDRNINEVLALLTTSLTHYFKFGIKDLDNKSEWQNKQKLAAEIINHVGINVRGMTDILDRNYAAQLAEISNGYYEKLGLPIKPVKVRVNNMPLTTKEKIVLQLIVENTNEIVDYDAIANALWNDQIDEKFSLYAISKVIERIRRKLDANIIHTQRGFGYMLYN